MRHRDMDEEAVRLLASLNGIDIVPDHLAGVARNLDILLGQAKLLFDPPINVLVEPAPVYRP